MPSEKLSQKPALEKFASRYDRIVALTPTVDGNGVQTGGMSNVTVPYRALWSPTMLVELKSDTDETAGEAPNNWIGSVIMESEDCLWNEFTKEFQFTNSGFYEVNIVGDVVTKDSEGNLALEWPEGISEFRLWLERGYTEVVPRDPDNTDSYRTHSKVADAYSKTGSIGFTERFYMNVVDPEADFAAHFVPLANLSGPTPGASQLYRSKMAVAVKRIGPAIENLGNL